MQVKKVSENNQNRMEYIYMKSKKKLIVIIAAAIVVIGGLIGAYIAFSGSGLFSGGGNGIEVKLIDEDTGEYMATGVPKDYVFSVETGGSADSAQVYDLEGNRIDASCEQTDRGFDIKAPKQGDEKGGIYKIELAEGCSFKDENLKKAKSLLFVVNKKNTADVDYTDEVKTPGSGSIEKTGNSLLLDGEYSSGDIVAADTDLSDKNMTMQVGQYSANNRLVGIDIGGYNKDSANPYTMQVTAQNGAATLRGFLWRGMTPVCEASILPILS